MKKSPNLARRIRKRNNKARDEEVDDENGIIYPSGYSVVPIDDLNSPKKRSSFNPFRPIHPQCNHISYRCLTIAFVVFVGIAVLLKTYLPDILPPSITRRYEEKKFVASDGSFFDGFGSSCSISDELVVIGAFGIDWIEGAAYLFHMDGTEVAKLTLGDVREDNGDGFATSVSMDEKVVVGTLYHYVRVFSRGGVYERTIRCDECWGFGRRVVTHGNLIVTYGKQNDTGKLFIHSTEDGQLLNALEQEVWIDGIAISEQFIVTTGSKTIIYSNTSPDFPEVAEINQKGAEVAVSGDRIVIGNAYANDYDGEAYLYKTDGTLVKTIDRQDASSRRSEFGDSVAITDDKVFVGAWGDDDQGTRSGSVFVYSAVTGEFIQKIPAPDGQANDNFGDSLCASDSHYMVGATGVNRRTGAAYLFQFSE